MEATAALSPQSQEENAKHTTEPRASKPAGALTPPTSEEMNHEEFKMENDADSELSELDLDSDDDGEEIEPDHYWDEENGGRIPVFKPTMDQFRSFKKFMAKIDKYGMKSGIVKVVPPTEWRDNLNALEENVKRIKIKNPITQEFNGTFGTYTQQNVEKQRSYNLPEWKALCEETQHQPPAKRGERRRNQEKVVRGGGVQRGRTAAIKSEDGEAKQKRKPGRPRRGTPVIAAINDDVASDSEAKTSRRASRSNMPPPTPDSLGAKTAKLEKKKPGRPAKGGGQAKSVSSRRLNNTTEAADYVDEAAFKDFDHRMDGLEEFTPERCAELETHYWKSLAFNQPMYAADMPGSLFDDSVKSWNVANLENLLDVLGTKVPGVNTAYLYMGMWKATFAWHLEDVDLYSINYIHFGAPKQWYSISQADARRFEAAMKQVWPVDSKNCDQFLRHKTYLISPDVLQKQYNVKVNKLVHYEGEFVITFPYGYHSGYNLGYNCAESVNFATESWLDYGRIARKCNCEADNVWVDVADIERKLRGDPTPEYYEETDDDEDEIDEEEDGNLPSPPASVKGPKSQNKKRKRDPKQEVPKKKKKIRIRVKAPTREPCVLCPNDTAYEPLIPTDNGRKAHRSCALFTPETWITIEHGKEKIHGVTSIDRARLELKCNFCRSKRGACFQCDSKKCTRAFHASCALAAGVQIDAGPVPTFGEDGTEYYTEGYDFRCRYHRPKMPKNATVESLESSKRVNNYAKEVKVGAVVQAQYIGGEVFAGLVIDNRPNELSMVVDVLPEGDRVEVEWKWLCVLDPEKSQRLKPSSKAIPMPEGLNKKNLSMDNRQDGVPTQDQPFNDNPDFKWQEFVNMDMPPPGYACAKLLSPQRLNVDITNQPDQLYYYLPRISTEARCFFTDTIRGTTHVAKSNFLDRVASRQSHPQTNQRAPSAASQTAAAPKQISFVHSNRKPYQYKPKQPARPTMMTIDHQALANQRNFTSQVGKPPSSSQSQPAPGSPTHGFYDSARNAAAPLREFPPDQYYSTKVLPAAFPGEYSEYQREVRRQSQGSQTMPRPLSQGSYTPNYLAAQDQRSQTKRNNEMLVQNKPSTPGMGGFAGSPGSRPVTASLPESQGRPSSAYSQHSPPGAPLTPATTTTSPYMSKPVDSPSTDSGYLANLQKYPYLLNCYLRKPKAYQSPYAIGGGYTMTGQTLLGSDVEERTAPESMSGLSCSVEEGTGQQSQSPQWTPPSRIYQALNPAGQHADYSPPVQHQVPAPVRNRPQATHQTMQDFQQTLARAPSVASRDGVQQRMLRNLQYMNYSPAMMQPNPYSNNFLPHALGAPYDHTKMWASPKAPIPSPLSDHHVPGLQGHGMENGGSGIWSSLPMSDLPPMHEGQKVDLGGYGPMLPQMGHAPGGNEPWRYN